MAATENRPRDVQLVRYRIVEAVVVLAGARRVAVVRQEGARAQVLTRAAARAHCQADAFVAWIEMHRGWSREQP